MCTVCGCEASSKPKHADEIIREDRNFGLGEAGVSIPGYSQERLIKIEQDILSKNNRYASANRRWFNEHQFLTLNLLSSPGGGKTTLLMETLKSLKGKTSIGVIEGDQATANDADKIRALGVPAIQINTGKACHLDAHMISHVINDLKIKPGGILFIENIGNLVCPAAFDLGESCKVVIFSVTEGEDKPVKYPDIFSAADLVVFTKIDLLPHLDFDLDRAIEYSRQVNGDLDFIKLSAKSGVGLLEWQEWILAHHQVLKSKTASNANQHKAHSNA